MIKEARANSKIKTAANIKEIPKYAKKLQKPGTSFFNVTQNEEFVLLKSSVEYIQRDFPNSVIKVLNSKESKSNRANFAEPTRFAIDIKALE